MAHGDLIKMVQMNFVIEKDHCVQKIIIKKENKIPKISSLSSKVQSEQCEGYIALPYLLYSLEWEVRM